MQVKKIKFDQWSPTFKFLFFPILFLFITSLVAFILTSFWKYDLLSAKFFAKGMKYEIVKYWTQFYSVLGGSELVVVIFLLGAVVVESFFKKQIELKSNGFFSKNRWWMDVAYTLAIIAFIAWGLYEILTYDTKDRGFGPGVDDWMMDTFHYRKVARIIVLIFQTTLLILGSYWVHFKLLKRKDFWRQEYWMDATKGMLFFVISYIVVVFLKGMLSRFYYYNMIFGDLLGEMKEKHPDWVQNYLDQNHFKFGFDNGDGNFDRNIGDVLGDGSWPWYKANGIFNPAKNTPQYPSLVNYAFPSGHVTATYCVGTFFFLLIGKNRKLNWIIKLGLIWFFIHLLGMTFAMVVMRGHWISDLAFSHLFCLALFPCVSWLIEKIMPKKIRNHLAPQN